jgi:hypothetical protein
MTLPELGRGAGGEVQTRRMRYIFPPENAPAMSPRWGYGWADLTLMLPRCRCSAAKECYLAPAGRYLGSIESHNMPY